MAVVESPLKFMASFPSPGQLTRFPESSMTSLLLTESQAHLGSCCLPGCVPATTALLGLSCCAEPWCGSQVSLLGRTVDYFLPLEAYITPSDTLKASTSLVLHPLFLG